MSLLKQTFQDIHQQPYQETQYSVEAMAQLTHAMFTEGAQVQCQALWKDIHALEQLNEHDTVALSQLQPETKIALSSQMDLGLGFESLQKPLVDQLKTTWKNLFQKLSESAIHWDETKIYMDFDKNAKDAKELLKQYRRRKAQLNDLSVTVDVQSFVLFLMAGNIMEAPELVTDIPLQIQHEEKLDAYLLKFSEKIRADIEELIAIFNQTHLKDERDIVALAKTVQRKIAYPTERFDPQYLDRSDYFKGRSLEKLTEYPYWLLVHNIKVPRHAKPTHTTLDLPGGDIERMLEYSVKLFRQMEVYFKEERQQDRPKRKELSEAFVELVVRSEEYGVTVFKSEPFTAVHRLTNQLLGTNYQLMGKYHWSVLSNATDLLNISRRYFNGL